MKKILLIPFSLALFILTSEFSFGQSFCDSSGTIAIYSNYDGGVLTINVDKNIPNLKIGIVSYENDSVILTGPYVSNITRVVYAGYLNTSHIHCGLSPKTKTINGAPAGTDTVIFYPSANYSNSNGNGHIICNYSCNINSNQGGCNTADQVAEYFFSQFGSRDLLFHLTQYGCWSGVYNISNGGNCCAMGIYDHISTLTTNRELTISPNPFHTSTTIMVNLKSNDSSPELLIFDLLGKEVFRSRFTENRVELQRGDLKSGVYFLKVADGVKMMIEKLVIE